MPRIPIPSRPLSLLSLGALALPLLAGSGCVSQAEYDRVKFMQRQAEAEVARLRDELSNERAKTLELQTRLSEFTNQMKIRDELIANLQNENASLKEQLSKANDLVQKLAGQPPVVVTETVLPPGLDRALKEFAARHPGLVEYLPEKGIVRFKSDLTFALGSYTVKDEIKPVLREFATIVASPDAANFDVLVVGNTDTVPIVRIKNVCPTNWHLSSYRAIAVLEELLKGRIDPTRCGALGYGEFRPIAPNPPGGNERNRRVEIYLTPRGSVGPVAPQPGAPAIQPPAEINPPAAPAAPADSAAPVAN